jgi:hypothetical protein
MASKSPHMNPAWGKVKLGSYTFGDGALVTAMIPSSPSTMKTDPKGKAGKSGAKVTTQGLEQRKGEIVITFLRGAWDDGPLEANLEAVDPAGANGGGPFPFEAPGLGPGTPKSVVIRSVSWPVKWTGELGTITLQWETPVLAAAGTGGGGGRAIPKGLLSADDFAALVAAEADIRRQIALHEQILKGLNTGPARASEQNQIVALQKSLAAVEKKLNDDVAKRVGQKPGEAVRTGTSPPSETKNADQNAPGAGGISQGISNIFDQIHNPTKAYDPASSPTAPKATP